MDIKPRNERRFQAASNDSSMLSKSLDDAPPTMGTLHRQISEVANISHSGYLLKRSNKPHASTLGPFSASDAFEEVMETPQPRLLPVLQPLPPTQDGDGDEDSDLFIIKPLHLPQEEMDVEQQDEKPEPKGISKLSIALSLNVAADFFGLPREPLPADEAERDVLDIFDTFDNSSARRTHPIELPRIGSSPIKMDRKLGASSGFAIHRSDSAPSDMSGSVPGDFVDPVDGHLWRAKFCVLEDGTLFFYRNSSDAECIEAQSERRKQSSVMDEASFDSGCVPADLSRSPVPRKNLITGGLQDEFSADSNALWEKRVALTCVGAVRSAEMEYGRNSLELLAITEDEQEGQTDKLVLRARNAEEMNEWLFQFHRSLASILRSFVDVVGTGRAYLGDIHHPHFSHTPLIQDPSLPITASPARPSKVLSALSPQLHKQVLSPAISLSHGHGRNSLHRRKAESQPWRSETPRAFSDRLASPGSTPDTNSSHGLPFPMAVNQEPPLQIGSITVPQSQERAQLPRDQSPELSAPQSAYPETERPIPEPPKTKKYIPPHLRRKQQGASTRRYVPPSLRGKTGGEAESKSSSLLSLSARVAIGGSGEAPKSSVSEAQSDLPVSLSYKRDTQDTTKSKQQSNMQFKRGGCADPNLALGSILDAIYIPRKQSRVGQAESEPYGCTGGDSDALRWEIGAVSECGVRDSNEDSYLVANDLISAFGSLASGADGASQDSTPSEWSHGAQHRPSLIGVFDGHCGDHAARYAAEKLLEFILEESRSLQRPDEFSSYNNTEIETILRNAISSLDKEFCKLCCTGGRDWESGTTALIAMLANEHLVIANVGDCRGVMCRSVGSEWKSLDCWTELKVQSASHEAYRRKGQRFVWRGVSDIHSPSREDERARIEKANGWITTEKEIPIGQLQRMDFLDEDVIEILKRCFNDRYEDPKSGSKVCNAAPQRILQISRVCGELAVSRAIGDREFKAEFNSPETPSEDSWWDGSIMLPYPEQHSRRFVGDLVSGSPDFQTLRVGGAGVSDEFLLLACDGLWDVMDADDAVRVTCDLLFDKGWSAKKAAARLAELAIHLGSSDNITVVVVRFYGERSQVVTS